MLSEIQGLSFMRELEASHSTRSRASTEAMQHSAPCRDPPQDECELHIGLRRCPLDLLKCANFGIGIVVLQDFGRSRALSGHAHRPKLAQSYPMATPYSGYKNIRTLIRESQVRAGHCIPAKPTTHLQSRCFTRLTQKLSIFRGDTSLPILGVPPAVGTLDFMVWIVSRGHSKVCGSSRPTPTTSRVHRC